MLVVGLIDIQALQAVLRFFFFFQKLATRPLVIWKSSDQRNPIYQRGYSHSIEANKSLSSVSELI